MKKRDQNKNQYGSFSVKQRSFLGNLKHKFTYLVLLVVFASAGGFFIYQKTHPPIIQQAQVVVPTSAFPGWWLRDNFGASTCDADVCQETADPDKDGLTNQQEYYYNSNPMNPDTKNNGMTDGEMVAAGLDPSRPGKISLDRELTDEEIFDESLLYDEDMKQILNELVDPTKLALPEVDTSELKISYENSEEAMLKYFEETNTIVNQYFSADVDAMIIAALQESNYGKVQQLKTASLKVLNDFEKMEIPSDAVLLHQYYMAMFKVLPAVLTVPNQAVLQDELNAEGNYWYDQAQTLSILMYKADLENKKLSAKYE
ncbi:MAG: hypothetical protein A3B10_04150 [Candidatus Doudnabacteria bacterium RIFCSPLOWO2_01_FULL_44_21]|uniref:Uncharacterized protein n=1 Tax=Candidatus Doudnabacteria bacterium RIFCSPLOWO2_01_FULL_44_21 TaxID=1817841 RepID=A0A1F5Q5A6_9BACT|nr:MAG: hypothetical protein A3B95_00380 [Candidatus Doudnabacteria bacterium RIFCSPHIGHO2_02_FULL_43_13b]OGE97307.1 MAG: hypothetical protein A3B10_04150 [Candidatus Doudnabacteria bacterium RIFCSPLOWO2_01_FULL_44_21]